MAAACNFHATLITIDGRGLLIRGESGSGKSLLALALIDRCQLAGVTATLVSDDQVLLTRDKINANCLIGSAPDMIAGLIEVRGFGPAEIDHQASARIDLVLSLVASANAPRLAPDLHTEIAGVLLPELVLPERNIMGNLMAILAKMKLAPFKSDI